MKIKYNNLTNDEIIEVEDALNPFSFEQYCGACIHFNTEECPHYGKILNDTNWKYDVKCNNFWD